MRKWAKRRPIRVWAIEGCQGIGRHIANRLLARGEQVFDVAPKLVAWARMFVSTARPTPAHPDRRAATVAARPARGQHRGPCRAGVFTTSGA